MLGGGFRDAVGRFATGITVVTGVLPSGKPAGITVSAFASVSLDPPLVGICLDRGTACLEAFVGGRHFAVNILGEHQRGLSAQFARRSGDKFAGVDTRPGTNGCLILSGCLAVLECSREQVHDAGDHVLILGRVERIETPAKGRPLLHFRGRYHRLGAGA